LLEKSSPLHGLFSIVLSGKAWPVIDRLGEVARDLSQGRRALTTGVLGKAKTDEQSRSQGHAVLPCERVVHVLGELPALIDLIIVTFF